MSQTPETGDAGSRGEFVRFWAEQGEEPAFLRRAKEVEGVWRALVAHCAARQVEMLRWARMRLAELARQVGGDWERVAPHLADARQAESLAALYETWKPQMPGYVTGEAGQAGASRAGASGATTRSASPWATVQSSLVAYAETVERFNRAWDAFLAGVDLREVNRLRTDYNLYYPIEKTAAFDTQDIERLGFEPLALATAGDLRAALPAVEAPALNRAR